MAEVLALVRRARTLVPPAHRIAKYGLTVADWISLFVAALGRCPICGKSFTVSRRPAVDHDHRTGFVRGLLCIPCNWDIGALHEDVRWLRNAAEYLSIPPAEALFTEPRVHIDRQEVCCP